MPREHPKDYDRVFVHCGLGELSRSKLDRVSDKAACDNADGRRGSEREPNFHLPLPERRNRRWLNQRTTGHDGLPTKTYVDRLSLTLGGVSVRLMHFGSAHTDGDSVVYFPDLKVVAVGHLFASPPDPDFSSGGSLVGWGRVLGEILKLDFDVVVPARGPTVTRADLVAYGAKIDTLVSRARSIVKKGIAKEQLLSQLETSDLGWRFQWTQERLEQFYTELSQIQ